MVAALELKKLHLDVVLYKEDDVWVAECAQLGLVHADPDREVAWNAMPQLCVAHVCYAIVNDASLAHLFKPRSPRLEALLKSAAKEGEFEVQLNPSLPDKMPAIEMVRLTA